jgi:hypothetical protein
VEAADPPSVPFSNGLNLSKHLSYIEDRAGTLSIEDVVRKAGEWKRSPSGFVNFGYSASTYWFRADIRNIRDSGRNAVLEIDFPSLDLWSCIRPMERELFGRTHRRPPELRFTADT